MTLKLRNVNSLVKDFKTKERKTCTVNDFKFSSVNEFKT